MQLPKGVTIIGFAYEIGVTVVGHGIEEIEVFINEAMFEIRFWLEDAGVTLWFPSETEEALITKRRKQRSLKIRTNYTFATNR